MSDQDSTFSADPPKVVRLVTSPEGLQEQVLASGGMMDAHDIHAKNVVVGPQFNIEHQHIHTGASPLLPQRLPLFMAADLPPDFVARPQEFVLLKQSLLQQQSSGITAITSALLGAGGYGKTTLAQALCHDRNIRERFRDGILWVTLGYKPISLISKIEDLIYRLNRERPGVNSVEAATNILKDTLADHLYLLVIDDVWHSSDLQPFLQGAPQCARLITTRDHRVVPLLARYVAVDAMRQNEAIQLLQVGIEITQEIKGEMQAFQYLASRLGEWPLLLTLANGILRERVNRLHEPLSSALIYLQRALDKHGIVAFDAKNASRREEAIAHTLEVSLAQLDANERERYEELAIFPEDSNIPLATVSQLWHTTGNFDDLDTEEFCQRLYSLSLLMIYDLSIRYIRIHDVVRWYLRGKKASHLAFLHRQFLDSYHLARWADLSPNEPYLWEHLSENLLAAEWKEQFITTVKDLHYLSAKTCIKGASTLEHDLSIAIVEFPDDTELISLHRHVVRTSHLLQRGQKPWEVEGILLNRFSQIEDLQRLFTEWKREAHHPWLSAWHPLPDLFDPALRRTLIGHTSMVSNCAISPDGSWLASASYDETLKIWDASTGQEQLTLRGHTDSVNSCAISPDGSWLVSASTDGTLKLWDASTGQERLTLRGHMNAVNSCAISPDGSWLVSASTDGTLKLWDASTGQERLTLEEHTDSVNGCAISPDGSWLVSASSDRTLKLWDVSTGQGRLTLRGHTDSVNGCAISPDGSWLVSASSDRTLKLWDAFTGQERLTLQGHTFWVNGCAISPNEPWLISAAYDETLKLWDISTGQERLTLEGHTDPVNGCAISPDGSWLVSASSDRTLKLWDAFTGQERFTLEGHTGRVNGCAINPDGSWLASASYDETLKIWDASTGQERLTLEGHTDSVNGCAISPDGSWLVSASSDRTLKLWDVSTGQERLILEGHKNAVNGCAISPDGSWLVSASADRTLKLWDVSTGQEQFTLEGHTGRVNSCAISPDGSWLVSASSDRTLKLWDISTGQERFTLEGHTDSVNGCAISPDGSWLVSASSDRTLKLWNTSHNLCIATFYGEGACFACVFHPDGGHLIMAGQQGLYFLHINWEGQIDI